MKLCGYHPGYCNAPAGCPKLAKYVHEVLDPRQMFMEADVCEHRKNRVVLTGAKARQRRMMKRRPNIYGPKLIN